jgi:putative ABC transport system permease protein
MRMIIMLKIAFRNLVQAKRRTLLLALAIAAVAMLFLILRTVSASVAERMVESATTLSAGHVNVGGFFKQRRRGGDPILSERKRLRQEVEELVPGASLIIDRHRGWARLIGPGSSINVGLSGIVPEEEQRFFDSLRLAQEKEYKKGGGEAVKGDFASLNEPNTALMFAAQAKKLEVDVGDIVTIVSEATGGQSNTIDLRVGAIASDIGFMSNWNLFVPRQTILDLYRTAEDTTGVIMVYLDDPDQATAVMEKLRKGLKDKGHEIMDHDPNPFFFKFEKVAGEDWLGQKLDLTIWSDEISFVLWITGALDLVSFFVVAVLAIIIVGGIINSMWMSVRERTKEIGTMRAIGAQRKFVRQIFVYESMLLGLFASSVGVVLGALLILAVNAWEPAITNEGVRLFLMANTLKVNLHLSQVIGTVILFAAITGLAALYPAMKAAKLRPVEALMQTK